MVLEIWRDFLNPLHLLDLQPEEQIGLTASCTAFEEVLDQMMKFLHSEDGLH